MKRILNFYFSSDISKRSNYLLTIEFRNDEFYKKAASLMKTLPVQHGKKGEEIISLIKSVCRGGVVSAIYYKCEDATLNFPKRHDGPNDVPAVRQWDQNMKLTLIESHINGHRIFRAVTPVSIHAYQDRIAARQKELNKTFAPTANMSATHENLRQKRFSRTPYTRVFVAGADQSGMLRPERRDEYRDDAALQSH